MSNSFPKASGEKYSKQILTKPDQLIFDLDNTLYTRNSGLLNEINDRINKYLLKYLKISNDHVDFLRRKYKNKYGTTLGGLIRHHEVNPDHYLDYVHDVPVENYLKRNEQLIRIMDESSGRKSVFTNGSRKHSERVLGFLGLTSYFTDIFDIKFMDFKAKPEKSSYWKIIKALETEPNECIIIEDLPENLNPALEMGMITVLVDERMDITNDQFHYHIEHINQIKPIFRKLGVISG